MPLLPHDTWQNVKLAGVVIIAALLAVFLLWLLFSGEPQEKVCLAACLQEVSCAPCTCMASATSRVSCAGCRHAQIKQGFCHHVVF